ncbi:MAG: tRNA-dihydrouridine synthase family protein [Anaerolineae bacterium]|nr:tRNA-dihydrouridine synthase family protein [Anaerolineae bacterium]MCO5204729.1 tRNA-dihydrouridine synthase family protein [Anaerolineae bacterium]
MRVNPTFSIRDVPVYGDVILAPMAGYADVPHRALCRSFGSGMNYTEFVAAEELLGKKRTGPAWQLLDFTPEDRPMVFQIFGNDARLILQAAQRIEELGPDIIDINMGCSTRKVSGRGAGVAMMRNPALVAKTMRLLTDNLSVPVTAKIRSGWEGNENYLEIGRILQDNGCAAIAIHPRTKEQKYGGSADWDAIAALKQTVNIPVIGNGDITSAADIDRMLDQTGCDAVMIGRGAIGNPWLFARRELTSVTQHELVTTILEHATAMNAYYGERGTILFRKYLKQYFRHTAIEPEHLSRLIQAKTGAERDLLLRQLLPEQTSHAFFTLSLP